MAQLRRSNRIAEVDDLTPASKKPKYNESDASDNEETELPKQEQSDEDEPAEIEIGDEIPDITLVDHQGEEVSLREAAANSKYLVLFAYPRASTAGCTRQACGFLDNYNKFKALGAQVIGFSGDSIKAQASFVTKQKLRYSLLSDPKKVLVAKLGAIKSNSGIKRSHWIFENGKLKVKQIQISPEVSITASLKEVQALVDQPAEEDSVK